MVWESQLFPKNAHFIFVELFQGFDHAAFLNHFFDRCHTIVVSFNAICVLGASGFNRIGVDCSLSEHPVFGIEIQALCDFCLYLNERIPNDLTLSFRICYIFQFFQELR